MLFHSLTLALTTLAVLSSAAPLAKRHISSAPVIDKNFPDPSYIEADGKYYAFSTESRGHHVPIAVSDDSLNWKVENYDALPHVGEWSTGQAVWAPHVVRLVSVLVEVYVAGRKLTLAPQGLWNICDVLYRSIEEGPGHPLHRRRYLEQCRWALHST